MLEAAVDARDAPLEVADGFADVATDVLGVVDARHEIFNFLVDKALHEAL